MTEAELSSRARRFWAKVQKGDGCWEWTGHRRNGYGILATGPQGGQRREIASRVSWELTFGTIPDGLRVLHHCDNPPCVRPEHLHLGTPADNSAEMRARGRSCRGDRLRAIMIKKAARGERHGSRTHPEAIARGSRSGTAKLDEALAQRIRDQYSAGGISQRALAAAHGINQATVWALLSGKTWR